MNARKLLAVAGCIGLGMVAVTAGARTLRADQEAPAEPLLDRDGRPAPGNVIGKGDPPRPADAGSDR